jgi:hypothetical protein
MMPPPEQPSFRKLAAIGIILLLILICAALVVLLAPYVWRLPVLVQALFYLIVGLAWIAPLKPVIRWSETGSFRTKADSDR